MSTVPGKSSDRLLVALRPDANIRQIQLAFAAFQMGGDEFYKNWWEFMQDVRHGHILPVVMKWDGGSAQFGLELMADDEGPYLSFLYYAGNVDLEAAAEVVAFTYRALQEYKKGFGLGPQDEAWVLLVGRPAWRRIVKRLGLYMDETCFISDQQRSARYGLFGWQ